MGHESGIAVAREVHLKSRPKGLPTIENFATVEVIVATPAEGEVLVRNLWMSVDPYMRGRMNEGPSYIPQFELGQPMQGSAIGKVLVSRSPQFAAGDLVSSMFGWRDMFVAPGAQLQVIDTSNMPDAPLEAHLGVLGVPGLTGYVALHRIAQIQQGEYVFISGATGAVGVVACALAKAAGCHVVGTAGSEEKRAWLERELGVVALNYRAPDFEYQVAREFPAGIDVYLDNVGGEQLRIALDNMREFGRIACCGMIDQYNDVVPRPGPENLYNVVTRQLRMQGFIVLDYLDMREEFERAVGVLVQEGKLKWRSNVVKGLAAAPQALIDLNSGTTFGKCLVQLV